MDGDTHAGLLKTELGASSFKFRKEEEILWFALAPGSILLEAKRKLKFFHDWTVLGTEGS